VTATPPTLPTPALPDLRRPLVAVGVAFLATAVVLSTYYSRDRPELDWSNYVVGLLATVGLLGVAVVAGIRARGEDADLVDWPGAFGIAGVGLMVLIGLGDADAATYVAGLAVLLLSLLALRLSASGSFVVTAVVGAFVLYLRTVSELLWTDDDLSGLPGIRIALALSVFAVLATVACWLRPTSRVLGGAVAGALTVAGFATLTGMLVVSQALFAPLDIRTEGAGVYSYSFSGVGPDDGGYEDYVGPTFDGYTDDGWTVLVLALLLLLGWAACAALTGHVAYRLLVVAMAVVVIPMITEVLSVEHPTWWGVALAGVGGVVLVLTVAGSCVRRSR
jgi:hypothetical protein